MRYDEMSALAATSPSGANVCSSPRGSPARTLPHRQQTSCAAASPNLALTTTTADLIRAVLEGVAANSAWAVGLRRKIRGTDADAPFVCSAAARSRASGARIYADALGREVETGPRTNGSRNSGAPRSWPPSNLGRHQLDGVASLRPADAPSRPRAASPICTAFVASSFQVSIPATRSGRVMSADEVQSCFPIGTVLPCDVRGPKVKRCAPTTTRSGASRCTTTRALRTAHARGGAGRAQLVTIPQRRPGYVKAFKKSIRSPSRPSRRPTSMRCWRTSTSSAIAARSNRPLTTRSGAQSSKERLQSGRTVVVLRRPPAVATRLDPRPESSRLDARGGAHEQGVEETRLSFCRPHDLLLTLMQAAGLVTTTFRKCFRYAQVRKLR